MGRFFSTRKRYFFSDLCIHLRWRHRKVGLAFNKFLGVGEFINADANRDFDVGMPLVAPRIEIKVCNQITVNFIVLPRQICE